MTNGNGDSQNTGAETPSSFEMSSNLPASSATGVTEESAPLLSTQLTPDVDDPSAKLDTFSTEPMVPVVQQPTSDIRDESQPQITGPTAETTGQKEQHGVSQDQEMGNAGTKALDEAALESALDSTLESHADAPAPSVHQEELRAEPDLPSDPTAPPTSIETHLPSAEASRLPTEDIPNHPPVPRPDGLALEAPVDPAPAPAIPAATSESAQFPETSSGDQVMQDAPPSPSRTTREREDDEFADGPAAKRTKTDEDGSAPDFKVPERPSINTELNGTQEGVPQPTGSQMTKPQQKYLQRTIGNVKRISAAKSFINPVDPVALNIPNYPNVIKHPMDLRTLEDNLKAWKYTSVEACLADFNLIVENAKTFNGLEHAVTKFALAMKASFDKHVEGLPGPEVTEPSPSDRKKKIPDPMTIKATPARRESRSSLPGSARSPPSASSPQTFALGPEGVPLIRRDSTLDGRPKREIHRPAPRDLPYANQKPKKKKFQWELKFCEKVVNELLKPKYQQVNWPFLKPVDPVALNIPSYHSVVKKPMDLSTIKTKLDHGEYENAKDFEGHVRLMFKNCYLFNPDGDVINQSGRSLEAIFDQEWAKKREWVDANTPASGPQSPESSPEPDSDNDAEEDEEEEEEQTQLSKLQQQIAAMSRQVELITQKKKSPPVASKKAAKPSKPVKKEHKKAAPVAKVEKKAAPKPAKKEKVPYVTYEQKQDISNRINSLHETKMTTALKIIRDNMPTLKGVHDDELELDIDELSNEVLYKLLIFVRKHAPRPDDAPARPAVTSSSAAPTRKKNKPMSKHEQEARIAEVQSSLSGFTNTQGQAGSSSRE